jgi:hypothetical protein
MPYSAREVLAKLLRAGFIEVRLCDSMVTQDPYPGPSEGALVPPDATEIPGDSNT